MPRLKTILLLVTIPSGIINGFKHVDEMVCRPCSPMMCRKMCLSSEGAVNFFKEDFSCRQISTNYSRSKEYSVTEDTFTCLKDEKLRNGSTSLVAINGQNICGKTSKDEDPSEPVTQLRAEDSFLGDLESCNHRLYQACEDGNLCMVQSILSNGLADINCRGKSGQTPVMIAAKKGQMAVFKYLVHEGCDLSVIDYRNDTVLHIVSQGGNVDITQILIENVRFDELLESRGRFGLTPLMRAVCFGHREVFDLLLSKGSNPMALFDRNNILHLACLYGRGSMVKHILARGLADIESRGKFEETPVMKAARNDHVEVVKLLKHRCGNLTAVDEYGNNILHFACMFGRVKMVKYILALDIINIESRGVHGRTPLMTAAVHAHRRIVRILLSKGCNLMTVDDFGSNAIHWACLSGHVDMVKLILAHDAAGLERPGNRGRTPIMYAALSGHKEVFDLLMSKDCDLTAVDTQGNNLLHLACIDGQVDMAQHLVALGVVDRKAKNKIGHTPIQEAELRSHTAVVDLLKPNV